MGEVPASGKDTARPTGTGLRGEVGGGGSERWGRQPGRHGRSRARGSEAESLGAGDSGLSRPQSPDSRRN